MDPLFLYNLLSDWKDKYNIVLNGTEPLLNTEYLKSFKLIHQRMVQTNGLALFRAPTLFDELHRYGIDQISISHHFQAHRMLSSIAEEIVQAVITRAVKEGFIVSINCTITPESYNHVLENCEKAIELGVKRIHFTNYIPTGSNNSLGDSICITPRQKRTFFEQINQARNYYSKDELYVSRCGTFEHDTSGN